MPIISNLKLPAQILSCLLLNDNVLIDKIYNHFNIKHHSKFHNEVKNDSDEKENLNIIEWIHNLEHHLSFSKLLFSSPMLSLDVHKVYHSIACCGTMFLFFGLS